MAPYRTFTSVSSLLTVFMAASGCLVPQGDSPDEPSGGEEPESSQSASLVAPCPLPDLQQGDDQCAPNDPSACGSICSSSSSCNAGCNANGHSTTCGSYGICQKPCSQLCGVASRCDTSCYQYGVQTTCGQAASCNPAPDCLVEFWTGYGYTGTRGCYGTKADVERVLAGGAKLDVNQVSHNDQYSSFRTIEQVCRDRGISPCHFAGVANKVKTGATTVHKDANLSGKSRQFPEGVDGDSDFDDDHWYNEWWQGDIDDKISSFSMDFSVAPTCYKAHRDAPPCGLCLDGGASLLPFSCTVVANPLHGEGWTKVDAVKNVWVFFSPEAYSPAQLGTFQGAIRLSLKQYDLVYPGAPASGYDIEWRILGNPPTRWFDNSVSGAF